MDNNSAAGQLGAVMNCYFMQGCSAFKPKEVKCSVDTAREHQGAQDLIFLRQTSSVQLS